MDHDLINDVLRRLGAAAPKGDHTEDLVRAALLGGDVAVARVLAGEEPDVTVPDHVAADAAASPGISLSEIVVEGFRGIGPEAVLELDPGQGLTLVVGRNGSGKSSFAEALELLLTGDSYRWKTKRSRVWREGWRNVHHTGDRRIELRLCQAGSTGETVVRRTWPDGADLDAGPVEVRGPDGAVTEPEWRQLVDTYRPVLSYSELGSMLEDGPSKLYDALATVLGLDDLVAATAVLADARKAIAEQEKRLKLDLGALQRQLAEIDDDRAREASSLLDAKVPDLDALAELATGERTGDATDDLARARQLADVIPPDLDRVAEVSAELRAAALALDGTAGTDADRALRTADLLRAALGFHDHAGDGDCPVCGRAAALDATWRADSEAEVARLDGLAAAARHARTRMERALGDARSLLAAPTPLLEHDVALPVDAAAARAVWRDVASGSDAAADPVALADHLGRTVPALHSSLVDLAAVAEAWWADHQDRWRPGAEALATWVADARSLRISKGIGKDVGAAEKWLIAVTETIQAERFAPTADRATRLWEMMRCASNVAIDEIALTGRATRRSVDIGVSVDGEKGAALGVMSQGELNTLALSLFLPRATLDASPFRFVVIDDPVQSMDPARVDGLARVLHAIAATHQVVVFTHDDRLPESVRRLQIPARVISVQRRVGSQVHTYVADDPAKVYLRDARHVMKMREVPSDVRTTVVPTLYRQALEAAALDVVRRRWITAGRPREDVERDLSDVELTTLMSFVVMDRRHDDKTEIYNAMRTRLGGDVEQAVSVCNRAAHEGYGGDLDRLGSQVEAAVRDRGAVVTPPPSAARSLASARIVLDHPGTLPTSSWTRAVAVLGRRALETAVDDYWAATQPGMARVRSRRAQFVCLRSYLDPTLAGEAYETWAELSGACHHQVVEVAPTDVELRSWLESVGRFVAVVASATA